MGLLDKLHDRKARKEFTGLAADQVPADSKQLYEQIQHCASLHLLDHEEAYVIDADSSMRLSREGLRWKQDGLSYHVGAPTFSETNPSFHRNIEHAIRPEKYAQLTVVAKYFDTVTKGPLGVDGAYHGDPALTPEQAASVTAAMDTMRQEIAELSAQVGEIGSPEHVELMNSRREPGQEVDDLALRMSTQERPKLDHSGPSSDLGSDSPLQALTARGSLVVVDDANELGAASISTA